MKLRILCSRGMQLLHLGEMVLPFASKRDWAFAAMLSKPAWRNLVKLLEQSSALSSLECQDRVAAFENSLRRLGNVLERRDASKWFRPFFRLKSARLFEQR